MGYYHTKPRDWPTFWMWLVENRDAEWTVPGDHVKRYEIDAGCKMVFSFQEDGGLLWIGYTDKWLVHMRSSMAVRVAWWILWRYWIVGTWCGLRRWIYFRALHAHVKGSRL